jgi:ABC-type uncharacterized transport system involved in gliding motility auxiliary subunit
MSGEMGGASSSLDKLLKAWGIQFDTGKVVADWISRWSCAAGTASRPRRRRFSR